MEAFADVRPLLSAPDVLFGNLEGAFSVTPGPSLETRASLVASPHNLDALAAAGFKAMSLANNHAVDAGSDALLKTLERLREQGIQPCGAGRDLAAARDPALVQAKELRTAFLAYASVFPPGHEATSDRPGVSPMRTHDTYLHRDDYFLPGTFPRILTRLDATDLDALTEDITRARRAAELVIVSFHWGDMLHPFLLTDHERKTARLCIELGAHMVVGHHHHALRGMEWYRGCPILYGLGHFVFDYRLEKAAPRVTGYEYAPHPRRGWPLLPLHPDTRMTMMACALASPGRVERVGFVPCRLRADGRVQAVRPDSREGRQVLKYLDRCNTSQALRTRMDAHATWPVGGAQAIELVAA